MRLDILKALNAERAARRTAVVVTNQESGAQRLVTQDKVGTDPLRELLDAHLRSHSHVACDRLTIADFAAASMATDWREAEMPFETFPNIVRWLDGLMRLPAWAEPWPDMRSAAA